MTSPAEPLRGLAIHTLFRGRMEQLVQWCNYHLAQGAEQLYVVLDCPAPDVVAELPRHPRIDWQVVSQDVWDSLYAGSSNFERKLHDAFRWSARRAGAAGHRFLAFIDADELLSLRDPFETIEAAHPGATAFAVPVREMRFDPADPIDEPFGATLALRRSSPRVINWSRAVGWRAQFLRNGLLGHDAGKTIYRLPLLAGEIGSHRPVTGPLAAGVVDLALEQAALLHFDSGSFRVWNEKWGLRLTGETVAVKTGNQRQAQELLFANALRRTPQAQEQFFRDFYALDRETQEQLEALDVLTRVDVHAQLDQPLPVPEPAVSPLRQLPPIGDRVDFQFALVCDQRFVKPTYATMTSVLSKMGELGRVRFVVLGDGLEREDVERLKTLEQASYDVEVRVHDITSDLDRDVGTEDKKRATFGRIYLVDYLPPQRTLYLDGDVLATRPFPELFSLDLGDAALAGVSDSAGLRMKAAPTKVPLQQRNRLVGITHGSPSDYLNGGVLIFDMDNPDFFDLAMAARSLVVQQGHALQQRDQDALNLAFSGRTHQLPSTYNYMTQFYVSERALDGDLLQRKYANADATLVHFSGKLKPWEAPSDEFYNGLYRSLVVEAEQAVGVSCEFYFSTARQRATAAWSAPRWSAELLRAAPGEPVRDVTDVELLALADDGAYLTLSTAMYELARSGRVAFALMAGSEVLLQVPLSAVSAPRQHLQRIGRGVRELRFDLAAALEGHGGVVRGVQAVLVDKDCSDGFVRVLKVLDVLAAGRGASASLLEGTGVAGGALDVTDGWMNCWLRTPAKAAGAAVMLCLDGAPVSRQVPAAAPDAQGRRVFRFHLAGLLERHSGTTVSLRWADSNVPLGSAPLTVGDMRRDMRYDAAAGAWVKGAGRATKLARRAEGKARRVARGVRDRLR